MESGPVVSVEKECRQTLFSAQYVHKLIHKRCSGVCRDLSRVDDDFRCRRCDGTIHEADLDEDLMVDREMYGCVNRSSMTHESETMPLL